jgi:opacity protein-like surface antigen
MVRKALLTSLAVVLVLSLASVAFAQMEKPYLIMAQAGYTKLSETDAPSGSFGVGGGLSYMLKPEIGIGAEVNYFRFGKEDLSGVDLKSSFSAIPVTGQIDYYIPTQSNMLPYVGAGAGLYNLRASVEGQGVDESDSANKFGTNFGGGVKFDSDKSISYGVDVRYHIAFQDVDNWDMIAVFGRLFF